MNMNDVARLPRKDRADIFQEAERLRGDIRDVLLEKDFWVCWTLDQIFKSGQLDGRTGE